MIIQTVLARTLDSEEIGNNNSGWIIRGKIVSDHYEWVNDFEAFHNDYGFVFGNFEDMSFMLLQKKLLMIF